MTTRFEGVGGIMKTLFTACLLLGACSSDQNLGNSSRAAYTTLAITDAGQFYDLKTDDTHVYWFVTTTTATMEESRTTLYRVSKTGGNVDTLGLVSSSGPSLSFMLGGDYVYAHRLGENDLVRVPKTGGPPEFLIDVPEQDTDLVATDADSAYLVEITGESQTALWRVPQAGGNREDLFTGPAYVSNVSAGANVLSWIGSEGDVWTKTPNGPLTRVMPSIGHDVETQRVGYSLAATGRSLDVVTLAPPQDDWYLTGEMTLYDIDGDTTKALGALVGMPDLVSASPVGAFTVESPDPFSATPPPPVVSVYLSDGRGRQEIWNVPSAEEFLTPYFDADGSAFYWVDPTTGNVNRFDIDLTSIVQ